MCVLTELRLFDDVILMENKSIQLNPNFALAYY